MVLVLVWSTVYLKPRHSLRGDAVCPDDVGDIGRVVQVIVNLSSGATTGTTPQTAPRNRRVPPVVQEIFFHLRLKSPILVTPSTILLRVM